MINSQSTITLCLPHSDGTAQLPERLSLYSEGIIPIRAAFNWILQLQKVITLRNIDLKTIKSAGDEYIIYRKENIKTKVNKYKVGKYIREIHHFLYIP